MKRPRCMKILVNNQSTPVVRSHNNTSIGNVNRTTNGFNLRQRSAPPSQLPSRILRNSEGGSGMKTHHNNYQTNGNEGMKGLASPEREKKSGGAQQYDHNDYHDILNGGGKTTSSETKGGDSSSGGGSDVVWFPKFMISLTNKEKEEDFMAIKGSKLPQRPKKRAKFIQRTINLVSPGGWLCDLTLGRYEVREKKITKKRPRGLKAMGNSNYVESDSE